MTPSNRITIKASFLWLKYTYSVLILIHITFCEGRSQEENEKNPHENFTSILNNLLETYEQRVRPGTHGLFGK